MKARVCEELQEEDQLLERKVSVVSALYVVQAESLCHFVSWLWRVVRVGVEEQLLEEVRSGELSCQREGEEAVQAGMTGSEVG